MIRSLYTAATGMGAMDFNMGVIANNLANVNTNGFKKDRADFQDLIYQTTRVVGTLSEAGNQIPTGVQMGLGVKPAAVQKIFLQGDFVHTGNDLDLAISGKGFFQVTQADGSIAYTRAGSFKIDNTGALVTSDGLRVEPTVTLPTDATAISVDNSGGVFVTQPGVTTPTLVGTLQLASFVNQAGLRPIGKNLFLESDASGPPTTGTAGTNEFGTIDQGFLELSNVSIVDELVAMITGQRAYEVNSKAIQASDEMLQTANGLKR